MSELTSKSKNQYSSVNSEYYGMQLSQLFYKWTLTILTVESSLAGSRLVCPNSRRGV